MLSGISDLIFFISSHLTIPLIKNLELIVLVDCHHTSTMNLRCANWNFIVKVRSNCVSWRRHPNMCFCFLIFDCRFAFFMNNCLKGTSPCFALTLRLRVLMLTYVEDYLCLLKSEFEMTNLLYKLVFLNS